MLGSEKSCIAETHVVVTGVADATPKRHTDMYPALTLYLCVIRSICNGVVWGSAPWELGDFRLGPARETDSSRPSPLPRIVTRAANHAVLFSRPNFTMGLGEQI